MLPTCPLLVYPSGFIAKLAIINAFSFLDFIYSANLSIYLTVEKVSNMKFSAPSSKNVSIIFLYSSKLFSLTNGIGPISANINTSVSFTASVAILYPSTITFFTVSKSVLRLTVLAEKVFVFIALHPASIYSLCIFKIKSFS